MLKFFSMKRYGIYDLVLLSIFSGAMNAKAYWSAATIWLFWIITAITLDIKDANDETTRN